MPETSDQKFLKAYEMACHTDRKFPPDIMLKFYAFYKRGIRSNESYHPTDGQQNVLNGFKANALLQVEDLSPEDAQEKYVEMVEKYIGEV